MVASNQQDDALATGDGLLEDTVDRGPSAVQIHPVKVEDAVRLD